MLLASLVSTSAHALVNLEYRPHTQTVHVGDTVSIDIYAVSDSGDNEPFAATDIIVTWDPSKLNPISCTQANSPYGWLDSGFLYPTLNGNLADGDAEWNGEGQLGDPPVATPSGLLLTTIQFKALAPAAGGSTVNMPLTLQGRMTRVLDSVIPNHNILGTADPGATVTILPSALFPTSYTIIHGLYSSGTVDNLDFSDNQYLRARRDPVNPSLDTPVNVDFVATSTVLNPSTFTLNTETGVSVTNLFQMISLYNYQTGLYELVDTRGGPVNDLSLSFTPSGDLSRFVNQANGEVRAKIAFQPGARLFVKSWNVRFDLVNWIIG